MLKHWLPAFQCILVSRSSLGVFPFQQTEIYLLWKELGFLGITEELTSFLCSIKFIFV